MKHFLIIFAVVLTIGIAGCKDEPPKHETTSIHEVVAVGSQWYGHIPVWCGIEK